MNTIFWFRRDLRLFDNVGLHNALKNNENVIPIFIFDENIISELPKDDKRITFIYYQVEKIKKQLNNIGSDLIIFHTTPKKAFNTLISKFEIKNVYTNRDYEPYAIDRDNSIEDILKSNKIEFKTYKDQVIFEKNEIVKENGEPYLVYTPFSKIWKKEFKDNLLLDNSIEKYKSNFFNPQEPEKIIPIEELGFNKVDIVIPELNIDKTIIEKYQETRDYPAIRGTSQMSIHLRFGTTSIRKLINDTKSLNEKFLNELIWREFFMTILYNYPRTISENFHKKYDKLEWRNNKEEFRLWCRGETGFPLVDAGMRELNETGFMHNRVRMVVANFLTKLLLIDWRWGEQYFASKLLDYELSSNIGNWQWAAGTGVDAAPYFRIFNPQLQLEKFDSNLEYVRKWIPEYPEKYTNPIIDYKKARNRCIEAYKKVMKND